MRVSLKTGNQKKKQKREKIKSQILYTDYNQVKKFFKRIIKKKVLIFIQSVKLLSVEL